MSQIQFSDFKQYLEKEVPSSMVLFGKDDYLKKNAIDLIKKQIDLQFPDLNICKIEDFDAKRVLFECNTMPFMDNKRLVVCYLPEKTSVKDLSEIENYAQNANPNTILVIVAQNEKPRMEVSAEVDCNMLDSATLSKWIMVTAKKRNITFEKTAIDELLLRVNMQMYRVRSETEKLCSLVGDGGVVSKEIVAQNVSAEYEYQVFVFADMVAKGQKEKALSMMNQMMMYEKNIFSIWSVLYNHFRRMFYAKTSNKTTKELADILGVKEFAITKAKQQASEFKPMQLKKILDILGETEINIKSGKLSQELAIKTGLISILNTRG